MAHNLANFMRTLAPPVPQEIEHWSLSTLREKQMKIGAKVVRHELYVTSHLAEAVILRALLAEMFRRIDWLRLSPLPP